MFTQYRAVAYTSLETAVDVKNGVFI